MKKVVWGIIIFLLVIMFFTSAFAQDIGLGSLDSYKGTNPNSISLKQKGDKIFTIVQLVGIVVSVIMLMAIGIKYMLGSVEEKADYKNSLKPYIIGAFILFTGTLLANFLFKLSQNIK